LRLLSRLLLLLLLYGGMSRFHLRAVDRIECFLLAVLAAQDLLDLMSVNPGF